jgi:hypothetical protein
MLLKILGFLFEKSIGKLSDEKKAQVRIKFQNLMADLKPLVEAAAKGAVEGAAGKMKK